MRMTSVLTLKKKINNGGWVFTGHFLI
jgi:3-hydroxymyristoyl/3-hydroxydecanoyl-(acyl carrier protein) dehydratase